MLGVLFAVLATACGLAVTRGLRLPLTTAPVAGLAAMAVLSVWCTALGADPWIRSTLVVLLAIIGVALGVVDSRHILGSLRTCRFAVLVLAAAVALPALLLGAAFVGVEAPVNIHDGAFHVESIDGLRRGLPVQTWYPMGFHTSVAAVLTLAPQVDTARGSLEIAQGLAILAPAAVFSLGLALGLDALGAAIAAAILALTWIFPYDSQLWAGWPQAMGVVLLTGTWTAALRWLQRPSARWAGLAGLFVGAIVLSHGTEVYSAGVGLVGIAVVRRRHLPAGYLMRHLPLALGVAALLATPYVSTLLGWAGSGGAIQSGELNVNAAYANPDAALPDDWLQFPLGVTGAAVLVDLPVRLAAIACGLRIRRLRLAGALWVTFLLLSVMVDYSDQLPVRSIFVVTFPWLVDHRPRQVAVLFASVLAAGGLRVALDHLSHWRTRLAGRPATWGRLALTCGAALGFIAEGSGISIYKRTAQSISEQSVYSSDDGAAMAWLKSNAQPGEMLANDRSSDAGIWAPYKADVPILLPRSVGGSDTPARESILTNALDLNASPSARAEACSLHVEYLYSGARPYLYDPRLQPDRSALDHAPGLEEVFSAGDAAVFRIRQPCGATGPP